MKTVKRYVSVTKEDGSFLVRGMASHQKTVEVFQDFHDRRPGHRAIFTLLSDHDGRMKLRCNGSAHFDAEIIGRAARPAALFGLLPETPEIALRSTTFSADDAESVIKALYRYGHIQFLHMVQQEIAG